MKKRIRTHRIRQKSPMVKVFVFVSLGCIILFIAGLFFQTVTSNSNIELNSNSVLGTSNKRISEIIVDGKNWKYKNGYLDIDLPGKDGQPNFYSLPLTVRYSDGTSQAIHLGFHYLQ